MDILKSLSKEDLIKAFLEQQKSIQVMQRQIENLQQQCQALQQRQGEEESSADDADDITSQDSRSSSRKSLKRRRPDRRPTDEEDKVSMASDKTTTNTNTPNNNVNTQKNKQNSPIPIIKNNGEVTKKQKSQKIPPIIIRDKNQYTKLMHTITEAGVSIDNTKESKDGTKIQVKTADDYRKTIQTLTAHDVPYTSYKLLEEKDLKIVIRGIPTNMTTEEVKSALIAEGYPITEVHRMHHGPSRIESPMVLVKATRNEAGKDLYNLKRLGFCIVRVEQYIDKSPFKSQCHRCQRFSHTQSGCTAPWKCMKCAGPHPTQQCQKKKEDPKKCANCKGPHPASYKGCPEFPRKAIQQQKQTTKTNQNIRQDKIYLRQAQPIPNTSGASYASITAGPKQTKGNSPSNVTTPQEFSQMITFMKQLRELLTKIPTF